MKVTERQIELLRDLEYMRRKNRVDSAYDEWAAPLDLGGSNGSHHSQTLRSLVKKGLVERKKYGCYCKAHGSLECQCKGSCIYRISPAGEEVVRAQR